MIAQSVDPRFSWSVEDDDRHLAERVSFLPPHVETLLPSLASLLLGRTVGVEDEVSGYWRRVRAFEEELRVYEGPLQTVLMALEAIPPSDNNLRRSLEWIRMGMNGEKITVFIPVCPDYATEPIANSARPYRFTFDGIGSGAGLVGERVVQILPRFLEATSRLGIAVKIFVGGGDFESLSAANLRRIGVDKEVFQERVKEGLQAIERRVESRIHTLGIMDLCGGEEAWMKLTSQFRIMMANGDFGKSGLAYHDLLSIVDSRRALYTRWFGAVRTRTSHLYTLLEQAAEYAAMGWLAENRLSRCLVFGADHFAMVPFYGLASAVPVVYAERTYE
jgi:hypothetical protein